MNTELFLEYLNTAIQLIPIGSWLIWDNIAFHKSKRILDFLTQKGYNVLFLAPYSPNENPIEHLWFHLKLWILKLASSSLDFFGKIAMAFQIMR